MQDKEQHLALQGIADIFGSDVALHSNFGKPVANDLGIFTQLLLSSADHLHLLEDIDAGVFLEERPDGDPVLKVLIEVGQAAFFEQNFQNGLLHPKEDETLID